MKKVVFIALRQTLKALPHSDATAGLLAASPICCARCRQRRQRFLCALSIEMDVEEVVAMLCVRRRNKKRRQQKKFWIHPFVADRRAKGLFHTLYNDLRNYGDKFFNYVRMSVRSFDELVEICRDELTKKDTVFRKAISPEENFFVTLRSV